MWQVKQKINLYTDEFRPAKLPQELVWFATGVAAVFVLSIMISTSIFGYKKYLSSEVANAQLEQLDLTQQLDELSKQLARLKVDPLLQSKIQREESQIRQRQQVLAFLQQEKFAEGISFSALADQLSASKGVWLQSFKFYQDGEHIELAGFSQKPKYITQYIESLSDKKAYQGRSFRQISISEVEGKTYSQFVIATEESESEKIENSQFSLMGGIQ